MLESFKNPLFVLLYINWSRIWYKMVFYIGIMYSRAPAKFDMSCLNINPKQGSVMTVRSSGNKHSCSNNASPKKCYYSKGKK